MSLLSAFDPEGTHVHGMCLALKQGATHTHTWESEKLKENPEEAGQWQPFCCSVLMKGEPADDWLSYEPHYGMNYGMLLCFCPKSHKESHLPMIHPKHMNARKKLWKIYLAYPT